ncbi:MULTISPECIES: EspA/EspE family type VII secretion system effector [unclassified Mycobacterium]|uniref:TPR repeat region-containing protein n=1 Tax=unclassified Mycobacterium TaxID=2642494 RepID=UPI0029C6A6E8|nr:MULTISPECIES: EspA/EspE family type VII secretion system effector [unclassified Mycobacterium]
MGVLEGFLSTWSKARETFGEGVPQTGERFDQSGPLRQMQTTVESAAPGSRWNGTAASAYGTANTEHGKVFGQLAGLDRRLSAQVTQSADIVSTGRQNLDAVRQWVVDAAASVPPGKNRETQLMPIVQKGLGQLQDVITTSNGQLNTVAGEVKKIGGEYQALGNQKFGDLKEAPDLQGVQGDEEDKKKQEEEKRKHDIDEAGEHGHDDGESLADGQLSPEESTRLHDATTLTPEQKADLDKGNLTIPPERMAYLNELSHSMDGKSPEEIKAALDKLPPQDAKAVSNALHLIGSDSVKTSPIDPSIKPGQDGYVPSTGGKENLPNSIQDVFDAPLLNDPSGYWIDNPDGSRTHMPPDYNKPYKFLDEYRDVAAISNYGDPALQRSSALNEGMFAESRELLEHFESNRWPDYPDSWGHENLDPTLQELISSASHDPVAVHDMVAGQDTAANDNFMHDLYRHDWADDGKAVGAMFPDTLDHSERAGQTMHAFDAYAGQHYQDLLNMSGSESLGQINPELVRALGDANVPYIDDMAGHNLDGTKGFDRLDTGANANNLRGLFAVIDSDDVAGDRFNAHAASAWKEYVAEYSNGLAHGGIPDGDLLKAVGKLQGSMDMGEYIHQLDSGKNSYDAAQAAWEKKGQWFDLVHDVVGEVPKASDAVAIYDKIPGDPLRDLFVGEAPTPGTVTPMPLRDMDEITKTVASYLVHEKAGDLSVFGSNLENGTLRPDTPQRLIDSYLSSVAGNNEFPYIKWSNAYEAAIYVSEGEFDKIKPPEK